MIARMNFATALASGRELGLDRAPRRLRLAGAGGREEGLDRVVGSLAEQPPGGRSRRGPGAIGSRSPRRTGSHVSLRFRAAGGRADPVVARSPVELTKSLSHPRRAGGVSPSVFAESRDPDRGLTPPARPGTRLSVTDSTS